MFEDILGTEIQSVEEKAPLEVGACPYCGSSTIEEGSGVFASSTVYIQDMVCHLCSAVWKVYYNEDLEVIDVVY